MEASETSTPDATACSREEEAPKPFTSGRHERIGLLLKGRYRIRSLIASGGMSDVYRAVDTRLEETGIQDTLVAVKVLRQRYTRDPDALDLLARETAKTKRLSHPNIIRVYDLDEDDGVWFMVMELLEGEPLSKIIQRVRPKGLGWAGAQQVLTQLVSALDYAHRRGIVHADLKPSNIFLSRNGEVKILDFGVARAIRPQQHEDYLEQRQNDETAIYGYTPAYASPALMGGAAPERRDDLYALACVAYELLSSRHPFDRQALDASERRTYPLKKPAHMSRWLWQPVRQLLRGEERQPDLATLYKCITRDRRLGPISLGVPALLLLLLTAWGIFQYTRGAAEAQDLAANAEPSTSPQMIDQRPIPQILAGLDGMDPVERAATLRLAQDRIIRHFSREAEKALQPQADTGMPAVSLAKSTLAEALALYPHDQRLLVLQRQLKQRNQSLGGALGREILSLLEQGRYGSEEERGQLESLYQDLRKLELEPPQPTARAREQFASQLERAHATDDLARLVQLLAIGDRFFHKAETEIPLLKQLKGQQAALKALAPYHGAPEARPEKPYPREQARAYFAPRFAQWQQSLADNPDASRLDAIYNGLIELQERVPLDLEPLPGIRRSLVNAYLEKADQLLEQRRQTQAQPMVRKATTLMRQATGG